MPKFIMLFTFTPTEEPRAVQTDYQPIEQTVTVSRPEADGQCELERNAPGGEPYSIPNRSNRSVQPIDSRTCLIL